MDLPCNLNFVDKIFRSNSGREQTDAHRLHIFSQLSAVALCFSFSFLSWYLWIHIKICSQKFLSSEILYFSTATRFAVIFYYIKYRILLGKYVVMDLLYWVQFLLEQGESGSSGAKGALGQAGPMGLAGIPGRPGEPGRPVRLPLVVSLQPAIKLCNIHCFWLLSVLLQLPMYKGH